MPLGKESPAFRLFFMRCSHWHVYLARCADGSLYTGITADPDQGIRTLNAGDASPYVRARLPVFLAYTEEYMNESDAKKRAERIRRMSREKKESLLSEHSYAAVADAFQIAPLHA